MLPLPSDPGEQRLCSLVPQSLAHNQQSVFSECPEHSQLQLWLTLCPLGLIPNLRPCPNSDDPQAQRDYTREQRVPGCAQPWTRQ